ncbi:STAS domain-containing protein [Roseinatronobacter alkalisoli]|uniref:Anti-sigma factor antagonist n=1 Tax=Roseinatronobacter alkalisoli TaxID=3028235 RepID=A0ABT5TD63_9RHOB|nr:STAS domain-containing protein [Roseinatronobacter sp. HJB301]MDD7971853.1 STAS domain-containing protein [Roseinatronobacter sp. HJB301]
MQLSIGQSAGALVIDVLETRLDAAVALAFKDAIRSATAHPGSPVILGLSNVEFMDSSGLGAIVGAMKLLGAERPLELAAPSVGVMKVFRLTRMDTVFRIHDELPQMRDLSAAE